MTIASSQASVGGCVCYYPVDPPKTSENAVTFSTTAILDVNPPKDERERERDSLSESRVDHFHGSLCAELSDDRGRAARRAEVVDVVNEASPCGKKKGQIKDTRINNNVPKVTIGRRNVCAMTNADLRRFLSVYARRITFSLACFGALLIIFTVSRTLSLERGTADPITRSP
eukprot:scaffold15051_cov144-Amphora_coffeaeformis.AAC.4